MFDGGYFLPERESPRHAELRYLLVLAAAWVLACLVLLGITALDARLSGRPLLPADRPFAPGYTD